MTKLTLVLSVFCVFAFNAYGQKLTEKDLRRLEGERWSGTLTYVDYGSGKRTSIKSDLVVERASDKPGAWVFTYEYPDEPKANGKSEVTLSADGKAFNGQSIEAVEKLKNGLRFTATKEGTDNNKKALFRYTYTFGRNSFSIKKEVRLEDGTDWFERNTYSWTRR